MTAAAPQNAEYGGVVIYEERPAPPGLEGIVARLWHLETTPVRRFEKILPLPFVHVIVNLSDPYRLFDRRGASVTVSDAFVSGLQAEYLLIESPPLIRHVGMELTPMGLHALAPDAVATSTGRVQDARLVLPGIAGLVRHLAAEPAGPGLLDLLEQYAADARTGRPDPLVAAALDAIGADPNARIGELADRLGVSDRALTSRFHAATGTTPKQHAQVLRFHRLIDAVGRPGGSPGWAQLAAASGYYDQPHVIRAFRRFSGWTPSEYLRLIDEHGPEAAHFVPLEHVPLSAQP